MFKAIPTIIVTAMAVLSVAPVCGADVARVRQIAGSIAPTTVQAARVVTQATRVSASRAATADDEAVCMGTDPSACTAQGMGATRAGFCNVEDIGFAACLASYAPVVVNHPAPARQVATVTMRDNEGKTRAVTVLLTGAQSAQDAATMALEGTSGETVVAVN